MKTFDRKIAIYSHSSLITFFNSILDLTNLSTILETVRQKVTNGKRVYQEIDLISYSYL